MSNRTNKAMSFDVDALDIFGTPSERGTPERNLLMAVLERAILDFVGNDQKEMNQAEDWLFEDDSAADDSAAQDSAAQDSAAQDSAAEGNAAVRITPFSFEWICQQLDLDTNFISKTIRAMPKRGNRRVAPWYFMKQAG